MLTLDPTTLFYWDIIHDSRFDTNIVTEWVDSLSKEKEENSWASSLSKRSVGTSRSVAPSLTNQSTITTSSVRTSDLHNAKHLPPPMIHVKPKPNDDFEMDDIRGNEGPWNFFEDGVILERDEIEDQEHKEAMKSSPKGSGVRLTSEVCRFDYLFIF